MSAYKTQRGPIRTAFTKAITELTTELDKEEPDGTILQQLALRLEGHHSKLLQVNDEVEEALLKAGDTTAEEFASEYASVVEYKEKFTDVNIRLKEVMEEEETSEASSSGSSKSKSKIRLPKLEFKKYGGDPREWLSFWGQFKSIHENESMSPEEKFQYLCQATTDNSRARAIVGSYPPTAENYPKVIESLRSRFGRDEILIEVYVRDLLSLVLGNVSKKGVSISVLYDKLETQLRALESSGVTSDKYAAMLFPLVESSLPEDMLRIWERSRQKSKEEQVNRLSHLMEFLEWSRGGK